MYFKSGAEKIYKLLVGKGILANGRKPSDAVKNSPTHIFSLLTRLRQSCCDLRLLPNHKILEARPRKHFITEAQ